MTSRRPYLCTKQWIGGHVWAQKKIPLGIELFSHVKPFFYSKQFAKLLTTWLKTINWKWTAYLETRWQQASSHIGELTGFQTFRLLFVACCHESILPVVLANCFEELLNPFTAKFSRKQISTKFPHFILWNFEKQIAPCVSTGRELSFEWSHHRILSTESKVRVTLQNTIKHSGSERVNLKLLSITDRKDQIAAPIRFPNSSSTYLLACFADVIQPRFVTTATQRRDPCSGPPTDSMNYRKYVSNFLYPDW